MSDIPADIYEPQTQRKDGTIAVLIITGDNVEDLEFFYPYYRFIEAGYKVDVATPAGYQFSGKHGLTLKESMKIDDVNIDEYRLLYLPGGKAPARLKSEPEVLDIVRRFAASGKPIASICHGPQILAAAGVIKGRHLSGWPEIRDEIEKAGARFVDRETMIDGQFITARYPGDLPTHLRRTLEVLKEKGEVPDEAWAA